MARPPADRTVILYSRQGCHLCDEAERQLRRLAPKLRFQLQVEDIERDDDLLRRYMYEIPVVAVNGREVAQAPIDPRRLETVLADAFS